MEERNDRNWCIAYTKPLFEKRICQFFLKKKIEYYFPVTRVKTGYDGYNKDKIIVEPLFKSNVFVHIATNELSKIRNTNGVISIVHWLGTPAIIKNEEIGIIKKFLKYYDTVMVEKIPISASNVQLAKKDSASGKSEIAEVRLASLGWILRANLNKENTRSTNDLLLPELLPQTTFAEKFAI